MVQLDFLILTGSLADANDHVGNLKDPSRRDLGYLIITQSTHTDSHPCVLTICLVGKQTALQHSRTPYCGKQQYYTLCRDTGTATATGNAISVLMSAGYLIC